MWLRRDLRLADNPALHAAIGAGYAPILVYIHAPEDDAPWQPGAATKWWLHHSLAALTGEIEKLGGRLLLRAGPTAAALDALIADTGATAVYWNRLYEPATRERDTVIKADLKSRGMDAQSFAGHLLSEPFSIKTGAGEPYRVFTPYWRNLSQRIDSSAPLSAPRELPGNAAHSLSLDALGLLPSIRWDSGFSERFTPGETGANEALEIFCESALESYANGRDLPDRHGTSRLSPHLHFGEISPRAIAHRLLAHAAPAAKLVAEPYLRELGWRDFGHHLLFHFPHLHEQPMQPAFQAFPWAEVDAGKLHAWQRGQTGIPIIDAGMRELWQTGWMHNRVRMIVASFLTKNLRYHWLHGARWFWDTLLDADLANNTQGWQWTAGCGADAAPYFRVFNPVAQGERFDPLGVYVKRFVPELKQLSAKVIHQPWSVGGVSGYPKALVDLKLTREAALAAFAQMRSGLQQPDATV